MLHRGWPMELVKKESKEAIYERFKRNFSHAIGQTGNF
jgi:hypothetical protein